MIVPVSREYETVWAELCTALWPDNSVISFLHDRTLGKYKNEFLYLLENKAIAFLSLSLRNNYVEGTNSSPVGYLEGIYVKPEFRNNGIAKELVEFAK